MLERNLRALGFKEPSSTALLLLLLFAHLGGSRVVFSPVFGRLCVMLKKSHLFQITRTTEMMQESDESFLAVWPCCGEQPVIRCGPAIPETDRLTALIHRLHFPTENDVDRPARLLKFMKFFACHFFVRFSRPILSCFLCSCSGYDVDLKA